MFFYELHESDGDIFNDLYLANEELYEPDEHGFIALTDARLSAAVRVSVDEEDNEITPTGDLHQQPEPEWGDDDEVVDEEELLPGHRTAVIDLDLDLDVDAGRRARPN